MRSVVTTLGASMAQGGNIGVGVVQYSFLKGTIIINNYNIMKANNNEAGQPLNNNE